MPLQHVIPAEVALKSPPEDLAGALLRHLASNGLRHNLKTFGGDCRRDYGQNDAIEMALKEVWAVLTREGFLADDGDDWYIITRRGETGVQAKAFESFRLGAMLPKNMLHPKLLPQVWGAFVRGEYDAAVLIAYREVEIAVRAAGKFGPGAHGVPLMRKAFDPEKGPLTDQSDLAAEREALAALFAGAVGSYKNPNSHRHVDLEAREAVEMIILASHLLSIVDLRPADDPPSSTP